MKTFGFHFFCFAAFDSDSSYHLTRKNESCLAPQRLEQNCNAIRTLHFMLKNSLQARERPLQHFYMLSGLVFPRLKSGYAIRASFSQTLDNREFHLRDATPKL